LTVEGSEMAFWQAAYEDHGPAVLAFLSRRLPGRADAEDLLQETFVRAIRAGTARDATSVRPYLLTTAHNLLRNRLRRPRLVVAAADAGVAPAAPEGAEPLEAIADERATPEQTAAWGEFRAALARALGALSSDHRRAFELGVLERHSYDEVARLTGWSLARVKTNIHRARKGVLARLGDNLPDAAWSLP
jgi:RNA polymerase sigma-70 factor, ECF subfamily